jgi:hypothetical protein
MSEEMEVVEEGQVEELTSQAPEEVQAEAEKLGWIPPTRYKGPAERFVDADEFIRRGETVLPILRKTNAELRAELAQVKQHNAQTQAALEQAQLAIQNIEERHTVATQKAVEKARAELKSQLAAASEAGDHIGVAELTEQMTKLNQAEAAPAGAPLKRQPIAAPQPDPVLLTWQEDNPWFNKDVRKTALAMGIAEDLHKSGVTARGREFLDMVSAEVEKTFSPAPREDKVAPNKNSSTGGPRGAKSYSSMPKEARDACDADVRSFVGQGKKYKTADEWRAAYAKMYFEMEQ